MDDQRLIARLRAADSAGNPRAAFVEELHADLATRLGLPGAGVAARARPAGRSRSLLLAATVSLMVALSVSAALIGSALNLIRLPTATLDTILESGVIRVAVRTDRPQAVSAVGSLDGFDVEFARYLADSVGVRAHLVPISVGAMLDSAAQDWQVGLPSQTLTQAEVAEFALSDPYYAWPLYLVTVASSTATDPAAFAGGRICAASGSAAELWLDSGRAPDALNEQQPAPAAAAVHLLSDDRACLEEVRRGDSRAMVTSGLLLSDLAASPELQVVGAAPVAFEPRAAIVPRSAVDDEGLISEINGIIRLARSNGTLAELSRRMFGGEDLTLGLE